MNNEELIKEVRLWRKQAKDSMKVQAVMEEVIIDIKKILGDIFENPQMQCYADNRLIPCQAPCGRDMELIMSGVLAIQQACNGKKETGE